MSLSNSCNIRDSLDRTNTYIVDKKILDSILIYSSLKIKEKKIIEGKEVPIKLAYKKWLISPKYLSGKKCAYERWENKGDFFEFWTIEFSNSNDKKILSARIDSICGNLLPLKISYQKKFRGHKIYKRKFVLFKHNFFSKKQITKYQSLIDYLEKDFTCW